MSATELERLKHAEHIEEAALQGNLAFARATLPAELLQAFSGTVGAKVLQRIACSTCLPAFSGTECGFAQAAEQAHTLLLSAPGFVDLVERWSFAYDLYDQALIDLFVAEEERVTGER